MCRGLLIIDTHVSLGAPDSTSFNDRIYAGKRGREHSDEATEAERQKHLLQSIDNPRNFWFTHKSLIRLLRDVGFTSVLECFVPLEVHKPAHRVTLVAVKGEPVRVSSYPWLNELSEDEIGERLRPTRQPRRNARLLLRDAANAALRPFGLELQRRSVSR
jgi:hypothetical protein